MLSAVAFLTIAGRGRTSPPRIPDGRTMAFFPVVGAGIGAALALVWVGASELWAAPVAAALVVAGDLAITGLLHVDGLADSADGLLSPMTAERRLAVMRTPDVGAFALAVVPTILLLRWVALAGDQVEPWALVPIWALSRTGMSVIAASLPYARAEGLASAFLDGARRWHAAWFVPIAGGLALIEGVLGIIASVTAAGLLAGVAWLSRTRVGGFTGDVLGAAAVAAETGALLVLAAQ